MAGGTPANLTAWTNSPPVFLYHGGWDRLVEAEQMAMMAAALQKNNREVKTYKADFLGHIAVYLFSYSYVTQGIEFLKAH